MAHKKKASKKAKQSKPKSAARAQNTMAIARDGRPVSGAGGDDRPSSGDGGNDRPSSGDNGGNGDDRPHS